VLVQLTDLAKRLIKGRAAAGDAESLLARLTGTRENVLG
jgi:hypothetical protein